ncbi:MAG: SLC13 family permease [Parvibaculaceae bacterium]
MTGDQILAVSLLAGMMALFVWGRLRYDVVATIALLAAVLLGLVPYDKAFSGFSDDIVIIVGSALLVSAAVARTGVMEAFVHALSPYVKSTRGDLLVLVGSVTLMSAFVKNIGALAIMMPVAFQMARKSGISPSRLLMPMAFGSLLGGLMTLVGTSPNVIVARMRAELGGTPFTMFDFTPVGALLAAVGLVFLVFAYRLLPERTKQTAAMHEALDIKNYATEAAVVEGTWAEGATVAALQKLAEGEAKVVSILRAGNKRSSPLPDAQLKPGDTLLLEGDPAALERMVARGGLRLSREHEQPEREEPSDEVAAFEAVVGPSSWLAGSTAQRLGLYDRFGVNLLAVSRRGERFVERLNAIALRPGDVIVLQGNRKRMPEVLRELDCLPLAEREIRLGSARRRLLPLMILAAAMILTATGALPVAIAFFGAAVLLLLTRAVGLREAYAEIEWPILVMLAALIPVSDTLRTTGATDLFAGWLSAAAANLPPWGALGLIMVAAMAVTPFLNNAATVLVMAPIAAGFAGALGYRPDAFLMAVAIGAGCDFLTPIGHQCNTLVMGPGGYRFGDYWKLGLPLSLLVILIGVPALLMVWGV